MESGLNIDINNRFKDELRELGIPKNVMLRGSPMLVAIAKRLFAANAKGVQVHELGRGPDGCALVVDCGCDSDCVVLDLMSLEDYGVMFLSHFICGSDLDSNKKYFMISIPEEQLFLYAKKNGIAILVNEKSEVRSMLDRIASSQPQTFFSLYRSARRLMKNKSL